jgi:hypothetical protein
VVVLRAQTVPSGKTSSALDGALPGNDKAVTQATSRNDVTVRPESAHSVPSGAAVRSAKSNRPRVPDTCLRP